MSSKFFLTTPIYYVNDVPHIGHYYTTVAADVLARWHRLKGDDVFLLTGTDENSQKNVEAAAKRGYDETRIQEYLDEMAANWRQTWDKLGISYDGFIRTTEDRHKAGVAQFWKAVAAKGDIYQGEYSGLYCPGCEAFVRESDLVDGKCPIHKKEPQVIKEKNYFFRLSAYREQLLKHIDEHPEFIQPTSRRNEVRSYIDKFMEDISITRESVKWGIPVPGDEANVIYVWFDALINYLTGVGYGSNEQEYRKRWPAQLHLVGKDIIKFHCALWPAMLLSAGVPLPERVFAHGFFTIDGVKMSKSLGNVVDPLAVSEKYGRDVVRFFLLREITFGEDGDFSFARLEQRYNSDLGNDLGNLLHRVLSMTEKYFDGKVPEAAQCAEAPVDQAKTWERYEAAMSKLDFGDALDAIWEDLRWDNKHIDEVKPWTLAKTDRAELAKVMYYLLEHLRQTAWLLRPFVPEISEKILLQLGVAEAEGKKSLEEAKVWGGLPIGGTIAKGEPLFPRREDKQ
ncbi:MAG: methionine--tRNA ligase [Patescibacteria group bacterium]|nr:methionine--tRNA ligase [Patescibacteria group bacterium]